MTTKNNLQSLYENSIKIVDAIFNKDKNELIITDKNSIKVIDLRDIDKAIIDYE